MRKIVGLASVVFLAVFSVYILIKDYRVKNLISENTIKSLPESISLIDQELSSDGVIIKNRIFVSSVGLAWPGFVAIYENPWDKYGTLVGASRFLEAGEYKNIPVDLVKSYPAGTKLYAVLHRDDGDTIYNLVQDFPYKKAGEEVMASFTVTDK